MTMGLMAPLGAQDEVRDAAFGAITCRGIDVVDEHGKLMASMSINEHGGLFWVFGKDNRDSKVGCFKMAGIGIDKEGGWFSVHGSELRKQAAMGIAGDGGYLSVASDRGRENAKVKVNENGGQVMVRSKDGRLVAAMGAATTGGIVAAASDRDGKIKASMSVGSGGDGLIVV